MWQNFQSNINPESKIIGFTNEEKRGFRVTNNLNLSPGSITYILGDSNPIPHSLRFYAFI